MSETTRTTAQVGRNFIAAQYGSTRRAQRR
jgi:hypothetical protein